MSHRLRLGGYSTTWSNKDLSNAFPSTSWRLLERVNSELLDLEDWEYGLDWFRSATIELPTRD
eukprot:3244634-Pyramimonas_sp.AAC.1